MCNFPKVLKHHSWDHSPGLSGHGVWVLARARHCPLTGEGLGTLPARAVPSTPGHPSPAPWSPEADSHTGPCSGPGFPALILSWSRAPEVPNCPMQTVIQQRGHWKPCHLPDAVILRIREMAEGVWGGQRRRGM